MVKKAIRSSWISSESAVEIRYIPFFKYWRNGFGFPFQLSISEKFHRNFEIEALRYLGKKIVYSNSGCLDGVSQTTFSQWPPASVCSICVWRTRPDVCSDEKNLSWGSIEIRWRTISV